jgi:hypothetical protein
MLWDDGHLIYDGPPALANDAGSRAQGNSVNPGPGGGQSADPPGSGEVGDAPGDDSSGDGKPGLGEVPVREPD